jgi:hypothetical protein
MNTLSRAGPAFQARAERRISRGSRVQLQSLGVIAALARRVRYRLAWKMLCERGRMMAGGTEGNTLAGMCFTGPVTMIGSPVCGSGFMLAIQAGTAPATARDQVRSWLRGGKMEAAAG